MMKNMGKVTPTSKPPKTVGTQPAGGTMGQKPMATPDQGSSVPHFANNVGHSFSLHGGMGDAAPPSRSVPTQPAAGTVGIKIGQGPSKSSQMGEVPHFADNVGKSFSK